MDIRSITRTATVIYADSMSNRTTNTIKRKFVESVFVNNSNTHLTLSELVNAIEETMGLMFSENEIAPIVKVVVTVEEIKNEYEKLNLPRKFDKVLLEDSLRNIKRYNLVQPLDKLLDMDAKIQIYASVMLAMPDTTISTAYEQTSKLLAQYVNSDEEEENDD